MLNYTNCSLTLLDVPRRIAVPGVLGVNCKQILSLKKYEMYSSVSRLKILYHLDLKLYYIKMIHFNASQ